MNISTNFWARNTSFLFLSCAIGANGLSAGEVANEPVKNNWLIDSIYPTSHHNPAQTDTTRIAGPVASQNLSVDDVKTVGVTFVSNPTMKHIGNDRIIFVSSVNGIAKVLATGDAFEQVSFLPYPGFEQIADKASTAALTALLDKLDTARQAHDDGAILRFLRKWMIWGSVLRPSPTASTT